MPNHILDTISNEKLTSIILSHHRIVDILTELKLGDNGNYRRKLNNFITSNKIDTSHFYKMGETNRKYSIIETKCPVCKKLFTYVDSPKQRKSTCSTSCANTYFRSGSDNPNWKNDTYRSTCFLYHKKECVVCKESNIVAVHHLDHNEKNNNPTNLVPLCPTHHQYWHSRYRPLVEPEIREYMNNFMLTTTIENTILDT